MKQEYRQNKIKTLWSRSRFFIAILRNKLLKKMSPVICVIVVNNRCNFNCVYCFGEYSKRKVPDYTTEELKRLIDDLHRLGTRYLNIHGGETLLRKDIGEVVDYIKKKGIYCCLITNGSLLKYKVDEVRNVDNITISLDGRRENNDRNRGKGSYEAAIEAIKIAKREKLPLRVSATLTKCNMNDIEYLAEMAKEMGFGLYFSILYKPLPEAKELEMNDEEIRKAMEDILHYKRLGYPIFTSSHAASYARDWPFNHNEYHFITDDDINKLPRDFRHIRCAYSKVKFIIEGDGNVYPCFLQNDPDKFKPLNWKEVGIEKAIEHVRKTNKCITCPALSQNDWNLLLHLDFKQIFIVIVEQAREILRRKGPNRSK